MFNCVISWSCWLTDFRDKSRDRKYMYGEGKRRNEFAEWHVAWLVEWHNYAECNIRRTTQRNKLNWKERPFGANKFPNAAAVLLLRAWHTITIKKPWPRRLIVHWPFLRSQMKILLVFISRAAWHHWYSITKVCHWRKNVLEGHAPLYSKIFKTRTKAGILNGESLHHHGKLR